MRNQEIVYAPVLICTLCRDGHFKRSIESLKTNMWAQHTDVYIAVDYPKTESHRPGYERICAYLDTEDFSIFKSFNVIKREYNYGARKNSVELTNAIKDRYDRWIKAEDDIIFSRVFLEYMDKCLAYYYDDDRVLAINGYSYPIDWSTSEGATVVLQNGTYSAWGVGHWKHKTSVFTEKLEDGFLSNQFEYTCKTKMINQMIRGRYNDYIIYTLSGDVNQMLRRTTDIAMGIYMNLVNGKVVTPVISKTQNHGFDGSGEYCKKIDHYTNENSLSYDYDVQPMDASEHFEVIEDDGKHLAENIKKLDDFLFVPRRERIKANCLLTAYKVIGKQGCVKCYAIVRSLMRKIKGMVRR